MLLMHGNDAGVMVSAHHLAAFCASTEVEQTLDGEERRMPSPGLF